MLFRSFFIAFGWRLQRFFLFKSSLLFINKKIYKWCLLKEKMIEILTMYVTLFYAVATRYSAYLDIWHFERPVFAETCLFIKLYTALSFFDFIIEKFSV